MKINVLNITNLFLPDRIQKTRNIILIILLFTSLLFAGESNETKQDTIKTRYYQLEGIRVVAEKPQESIGSIAVKSFDLKQTTPELNIAEAVDDVVGLNISTGGKSGSDLRIRGFQNNQIKFMLDGRPLGGGYFGNVDLSTIPISEIKEIQVLKGPVSALYGADTMGGVVNIISKNVGSESWLKAGIQAKRNNTNKVYLSSAHDMGFWDYWIYTSRYHTDGFMLSDDFEPTQFENGSVRNYTGRNQYDFQSKLNFTLFDFHSLGIQAGYTFMDKKEIPSNIYENSLRDFTEWHRLQLSALGSFQLSPYLKSNVNVYYDQYDDTYAEYNSVTGEMYSTWPSYLESWIFGMHQKNDWEITSNLRALFGYRFEKEVYNRKDNGSYPDWTTNNQIKHNGFGQAEYKWQNFTLSAGTGISSFRPNGKNSWQTNLEPSAGIYWEDLYKISLAYSSNTRYPNLHELFSASSGNLDLEEQRAQKYEFTNHLPFSVKNVTGSFSSSFYYNDIRNLIDKVGDAYNNIYKIQNYGTEFSLILKLFWEHKFDYAYIEYLDESNLSLLEVPQHTFNLNESLLLLWDVKMQYKADWKDVRKADDEGGRIVTLDSYWLHSVFFHKNWKKYKFMLGMENILDKNYMEKYGYPGPGMNFVINVEVEI